MTESKNAVNSANLGDVKIDGQHVSRKQGSNPADCAWIREKGIASDLVVL